MIASTVANENNNIVIEGKSKRPPDTPFRQQRLKSCQPILTPRPVIITFFIIALIFVPLGIIFVITSNNVLEVSKRYDNICNITKSCSVNFEIPKTMNPPIYMYYKLTRFYQNHRRYAKSLNDNQLSGKRVTSYSSLSDCSPLDSFNKSKNAEDFYYPCGLIANSLFNDTFVLSRGTDQVIIANNGIAWNSDVKSKFKNCNDPKGCPGRTVLQSGMNITALPGGLQNEHFAVWNRLAGLSTFKKLWGRISNSLQNGNYTFTIDSNFPTQSFNGRKYVVLSTSSWMGGKNIFLGIVYLVVGGLCFVLGFIFAVINCVKPRELGDTTLLSWNRDFEE
eukprot:TRINITY_DN12151_c0_g1_i1.p1 TRINITY_DN12151_c0_g1~~TRINITY_DN12151_c0_g1_i1.p1  ORF type:complete len:335 (-),score=62.43 TRINITY_DN12151_c0_g1_i1:96-1100(-)